MKSTPAVEVKVGQVWKDCDKRCAGRFLRVVGLKDGKAVCQRCDESGRWSTHLTSAISVQRMRPGASGYQLVTEAK